MFRCVVSCTCWFSSQRLAVVCSRPVSGPMSCWGPAGAHWGAWSLEGALPLGTRGAAHSKRILPCFSLNDSGTSVRLKLKRPPYSQSFVIQRSYKRALNAKDTVLRLKLRRISAWAYGAPTVQNESSLSQETKPEAASQKSRTHGGERAAALVHVFPSYRAHPRRS